METLNLFPTPVGIFDIGTPDEELTHWLKFQVDKSWSDRGQAGMYGTRSTDERIINWPQMKEWHDKINSCIVEYNQEHFHFDFIELRFTQSWVSRKDPGEIHTPHVHPNSMFSAVWFFDDDDNSKPALTIHESLETTRELAFSSSTEHEIYGLRKIDVESKPGRLVVFRSNIPHSVPRNNTDHTRWSLAMNTLPAYEIGNPHSLTGVDFTWLQ